MNEYQFKCPFLVPFVYLVYLYVFRTWNMNFSAQIFWEFFVLYDKLPINIETIFFF